MRARRAIQKHGLRRSDNDVESPDVGLALLKGNVAAVHGVGLFGLHRLAPLVFVALRDGVVSVAELELHHVSDGCPHEVWDKGVLRAAHHDGDDGVASGLDGCVCANCVFLS